MKRNLLRILPFLLLGGALGLTAAPAAFEAAETKAEDSNIVEVSGSVFDGQGDSPSGKNCSYKTNGVTISTSNGYGTGGRLRIYGNKTLNISSTDYKISKVELTMPDSSYVGLNTVYDNIDSTSFSATTTKQTRISNFKITLSTEGVVLSSLSVDTSKATTTFTKGQTLDLTGVKVNGNKVGGGSVDVTSKCTFSPASGTKLDEVGSTTINVTYAGTNTPETETGEDLTTSYNVIVSDGPSKAIYTKVTTNSLKANDKVILVDSANKLAATKGLTSNTNAGKHYLDRTAVTIEGNDVSFDPDSDVCVFTVAAGKLANTYALINEEGKYLGAYSTSYPGLKYETSVTNNSSWTIDIENANPKWAIKANHNSAPTADSEIYLMSGVDMRLCKAGSGNGAIDIYKYSSGNERVTLDASTKEVYEKYTTTITATPVEFDATSWSWESSNTAAVSVLSGGDSDTVTVKGIAPGSSNLTVTANGKYKATCVVTCKSAGSLVIEPGEYFITDLSNKYLMGSDLSTVTDIDISKSDHLYTFEFAGLGDGTYWISNTEGKYLAFRQNVIPDGKNVSEMTLTNEKVDYWTITKNASNEYKVATQYGAKTKSIAQDGDHDWLAFDGDNFVNLTKQGNFVGFEPGHAPQYTKYYVGEKFKTTGLVIYAVFEGDFRADITSSIVWDELEAGHVATGKITIGGVQRTVTVEGLSILGPVEGSMQVAGLRDTYLIGEMPKEIIDEVRVTYSDGVTDEIKTLKKDEYTVSPDKVNSETNKVVVSMVDFPDVKYEKEITPEHAKYFATSLFEIGDKVTLGTTVAAADGNILGGQEIAMVEGQLKSQTFGYLPTPAMEFEVVQGVSAGSYAFKYGNSYLTSNGKTLDFGNITEIPFGYDNGLYFFDYPFYKPGTGEYLKLEFEETEKDSLAFKAYHEYSYSTGERVYAEAIIIDETIVFTIEYYTSWSDANPVISEPEYRCAFNGTWVLYIESDVTVNTKNSFTCTYVESQNDWVDDYWEICPLNEPTKRVYFNQDSFKFGVGTNADYNVMLYRDMSKDFSHEIKSISVSIPEDMPTTVELGEPFNWVGITVKAKFDNTTKKLPLGAYEVDVPASDTYGDKICTVTYGTEHNKVTATFKYTVVGGYQPFIKQNTYEVWVDDINTFTTTQEPPEGEPVTWSSSDDSIATFEDPHVGDLKSLKSGKVTITVTSFDGYYSDSKELTVSQRPTGLTISETEKTIKQGETFTLVGTVSPEDAKNKTVLWSSSDTDIATVNSKGEVTGLGIGDVVITGQTQGKGTGEKEGYKATCTVHVEQGEVVRVTGVSLDCTNKQLKPGDTFQLNAIINPSNATEKGVTWESNAPQLADVSKSGKVTVKNSASTGKTVYISCTTLDGGFTAECEIKIVAKVDPVPVTKVTLNATSKKIAVNDFFELTATVEPTNADEKQVTFTSSNDSIAKVDQYASNGAKITGLKDGVATITARCGGKEATCTVTVGNGTVPVTSVSLSETSVELFTNETKTLTARINPSDATNKNVTWTSSDTSIVTVDSNGKITAVKEGTATITVTTVDGGKTATCSVTVKKGNAPTPDGGDDHTVAIIIGVTSGVAAVGIGCGVGIPLGIRAHKKRKLGK